MGDFEEASKPTMHRSTNQKAELIGAIFVDPSSFSVDTITTGVPLGAVVGKYTV